LFQARAHLDEICKPKGSKMKIRILAFVLLSTTLEHLRRIKKMIA